MGVPRQWYCEGSNDEINYTVVGEISVDNNFNFDLSSFNNADFSKIDNNYEVDLIKKIADWNKVIESATNLHEPHRIAYYLYELSSVFHTLWSQGKIDRDLKFIIENTLMHKKSLKISDKCKGC